MGPLIEATSLLGAGLVRPDFDEETTRRFTENLREAIEDFNRNPDDPESIIWVGRRTAYFWRFQDAIVIYSDGISQYSEYAPLYRHRGHRYISIRRFDEAVKDLEKAVKLIEGTDDVIEQDGAPNQANIPVSTLHFNIWYHLGVAYYLKGDYSEASRAFESCLEVSSNNDTKVSTVDWLYMTYRKLGKQREAEHIIRDIDEKTEVLESQSYLNRILMYKGKLAPEELLSDTANTLELVTQGYGVAMWLYHEGETKRANEILSRIIETNYWAAFGYIAAEAELSRMKTGIRALNH